MEIRMLSTRRTSRLSTRFCLAVGATLVMAGAVAAQQPIVGVEAQMDALDAELADHPRVQVTDIYKFLHQGCFGPGHAVSERSAARTSLVEELDGLEQTDGSEPLCQPLGGEPEMVRIHLRPFLAVGADPEALFGSFVASAEVETGDPERMALVLDKAVARLSRRGRWQQASQLEELGLRLAAEGYPAAHHSEPYTDAYRPAYRVVLRELAVEQGWCEESQ
jgi:hypothetical protein